MRGCDAVLALGHAVGDAVNRWVSCVKRRHARVHVGAQNASLTMQAFRSRSG
jgi:hypothetical protein